MAIGVLRKPLHSYTTKAIPRYRRILALYEGGTTAAELGREFGVSRSRILQIVARAAQLRAKGIL